MFIKPSLKSSLNTRHAKCVGELVRHFVFFTDEMFLVFGIILARNVELEAHPGVERDVAGLGVIGLRLGREARAGFLVSSLVHQPMSTDRMQSLCAD